MCECLLLLAFFLVTHASATTPINPASEKISTAAKSRIQSTLLKAPLHFEANQGQIDAQVKFLARGSGYSLFLTATEAVMVLREALGSRQRAIGNREKLADRFRVSDSQKSKSGPADENLKSHVVRMKLMGANPAAEVVGLQELPGKVNYFIGNDQKKWRANVPTYGKVEYRDVYPGTNLLYYGNQGKLEYDFVVSPGADPKAIQLAFDGADKVEKEGNDLVITTASGSLRMHKPRVYQEVAGVRKKIFGEYVLEANSEIANPKSTSVSFQIAAYDVSKPLIIDPVIEYATYLGGSDIDSPIGISVDALGNVYLTGATKSGNFPIANAFDPSLDGENDAFVLKLSPDGSELVYSTYLGGSGHDDGFGIASDPLGVVNK